MKKIIIKGIIFIIIGFILGNYLFGNKLELLKKRNNYEIYYFLQEGVYSSKENLNNNLKRLSQKVIDYKDNKYYVYIGITKDKKVSNKIKKIYEKQGFKIYEKELLIESSYFSSNVDQFDLLIKSTNNEDEILTIEEIVLANYEEIKKNSSKKE